MISDSRRSMMLATGAALVAAGTAGLPVSAGAQAPAPREGKDYRLVRPTQPTDVPAGKIEAIEFFWYGCPHCNSLEPALEQWVAKLPDDVVFRRIHVPFGERRHQQLFYALESMGKEEELHKAVFHAIHVDRDRLDTVDRMVAMLSKQGVDEKQFRDTFDSFAVRTKMRRAAQTVDAYGVDGVPAMAVAGKYYTAPSMAGSNGAALRVMEQLIDIERNAAKK